MGTPEHYVWAGRLRNLRPILVRWADFVLRAAKEWGPEDCPWWYRERPLVGILAAACWDEGGAALTAYEGTKGRLSGGPYTGRYDLFLALNQVEYQVEAKFAYANCAESRNRIASQIDTWLSSAEADVVKADEGNARRLGIAFIAPYIRDGDPQTMLAGLAWWKEAVDSTRCAAYAWVLPRIGWKVKWKNDVHPRVAMLVRTVN